MATKSVLKSTTSALLALALGTAMLAPGMAFAQERQDRGERGAGRIERSAPVAIPRSNPSPAQAPSWQSRGPSTSPQPSWSGRPAGSSGGSQAGQVPQPSRQPSGPGGWNGRPAWQGGGSQAGQVPQPSRQPANPGGWNGRPASQNGSADRERGDRGNGAYPAGQPTFGRPNWQGGGSQGTSAPSWGGRNPTYVDPSRGNPGTNGNGGRPNRGGNSDGRDNNGRGGDNAGRPGNNGSGWTRDRDGQWSRSDGAQWRQDDRGQWGRDRDRDANWGRNNNGQWSRNGWRNNTSRDWRRGRSGWGNNNWGYNHDRNDGWWGGNGGRGWDRDGWRRDNRYDWSGWRNRNRSTFSLGFYYAPWQDYSYSRFGIGVVIGQPFYDQRYWIADPYAYRLPPAWGPYRWVRYYDDALLVDIYTGEVVDAIYDIFY